MGDEHPVAERPDAPNSAPRSSSGAGEPLGVVIRHAKASDYGRVIGRINVWWGGRDMAPMLPKLFFIHFEGTSFVAEGHDGELLGFVCGFLSQAADDEAYIHFVGVTPEDRGEGLGRALYERFFEEARKNGRTAVRCVTSPTNRGSISFHEALGFEVERIVEDYDGPGEDRALLVRRLT